MLRALAEAGTKRATALLVRLADRDKKNCAAVLGAFVHGHAADRRAASVGDAGLLAGELAAALPAAQRSLRDAAHEPPPGGEADALAFPEPG